MGGGNLTAMPGGRAEQVMTHTRAELSEALAEAANRATKAANKNAAAVRAAALEAQALAHARELERVQAEQAAARKAGERHGFHVGALWVGLPALLVGACAATLALLYMQGATLTSAADAFNQNAITGAMIQRYNSADEPRPVPHVRQP